MFNDVRWHFQETKTTWQQWTTVYLKNKQRKNQNTNNTKVIFTPLKTISEVGDQSKTLSNTLYWMEGLHPIKCVWLISIGGYHSVRMLNGFSNSNIYIGPRQFLTQRTRHASVAQLCTRGLFTSTDSSACSWKAFATGESYSIIPSTAISVLFVFERENNGCLSDVILADKQSKVWPKWRN